MTADYAAHAAQLAGKYMVFRLEREHYAIPVLKVQEIIGQHDVTRVPGAPQFVLGVINLRGRVVPVVDLRMKFGLAPSQLGARTVIVVVSVSTEAGPLTLGVVVDEVLEVRAIATGMIEPPPTFGGLGADVDFILGVGRADKQRVAFLLDIDRVLSSDDVTRLPQAMTETAAAAAPA